MAASTSPEPVSAELEALVMRHAAEMDVGNVEAANASMREVMDFVLQQACENPPPDFMRGLLADRAIDEGDWDTATSFYQEQLQEAREETNVNVRPSLIGRALLRLGAIELRRGSNEQAFQLALEGMTVARTAEWDGVWVFLVDSFAAIAVRTGHFEEALHAAEDALANLEDRHSFDLLRAMLVLVRCEALLGLGRHEEINPNLDEAWKLLQPLAAMSDAPGVLVAFGDWWRLEAYRRIKSQDWPGASQAFQKAVPYFRRVAETWDCDSRGCNARLAKVLAEYADAADNLGEEALATQLRFERWQVCRANPGLT